MHPLAVTLILLAAIAGAAALAAAARLRHYAVHVEPNRIEVTRHDVAFPDLPPQLDGMTICQVSDLHITTLGGGRNASAIADALRQIDADLYVFTGDMIYRQDGIAAFFRWFDALGDAVRPAVAIRGNAEHKPYIRRGDVLQGFAARGVPVLNNAVYRFPYCGTELQIVGVDDPHTFNSDFKAAYANADPAVWTLLLCHSPDGVLEMEGCRADLMLCGHTHGGQIRLPLVGALAHGTIRLRGLVAGWYDGDRLRRKSRGRAGSARMYVSRGLGMSSKFPGRLLCPPEIPVFTLRRQAGGKPFGTDEN